MAAGIKDITKLVAEDVGISQVKTKEVVGSLFNKIEEIVNSGDALLIRGFGTFKLKTTKERKGRHPQTGAEITIPPRTRMTFKASKA